MFRRIGRAVPFSSLLSSCSLDLGLLVDLGYITLYRHVGMDTQGWPSIAKMLKFKDLGHGCKTELPITATTELLMVSGTLESHELIDT